mmetsp:Transcript_2514/g.5769  ORF Transcript_2514/g.5769 Transcript_2514/m.5769 type:complete len:223 (-) Transcript_2514:1015-1683(-)
MSVPMPLPRPPRRSEMTLTNRTDPPQASPPRMMMRFYLEVVRDITITNNNNSTLLRVTVVVDSVVDPFITYPRLRNVNGRLIHRRLLDLRRVDATTKVLLHLLHRLQSILVLIILPWLEEEVAVVVVVASRGDNPNVILWIPLACGRMPPNSIICSLRNVWNFKKSWNSKRNNCLDNCNLSARGKKKSPGQHHQAIIPGEERRWSPPQAIIPVVRVILVPPS